MKAREFKEMVFQYLGTASVAWDENEVFDSELCTKLGNEIVENYDSLMVEAVKLREELAMVGSEYTDQKYRTDVSARAINRFDDYLEGD